MNENAACDTAAPLNGASDCVADVSCRSSIQSSRHHLTEKVWIHRDAFVESLLTELADYTEIVVGRIRVGLHVVELGAGQLHYPAYSERTTHFVEL